jgi:hypothetical protein
MEDYQTDVQKRIDEKMKAGAGNRGVAAGEVEKEYRAAATEVHLKCGDAILNGDEKLANQLADECSELILRMKYAKTQKVVLGFDLATKTFKV